jgi:predicted nucleic acid-binding protein
MGLIEDLGGDAIALDTAPFIYFIEEHPVFGPVVEPIFIDVDRGVREVVTSALTLLEVLVVPFRAGDLALAGRYEDLLGRSRGVRLVDLDRDLLRAAAHLRAGQRLRTPDALQVAAALSAGCTCFVTSDRTIPAIPGLRVLRLPDYVASA